jgi:threonine dehydratase
LWWNNYPQIMVHIVSFSEVEAAIKRISPYVVKTPILSSTLLNKWLGHEIHFKAEGMQKTGAFKVRGASNVVGWLIENGNKPQKIVANSSGNHAQAVALAAQMHDIPATIYMPDFASKIKIQATKAYGAEVVLCRTRVEADRLVEKAAGEKGVYWIPPYNHRQIVAGQGTAAAEALVEIGNVDLVCAPCGGGGLLSGTWVSTHHLCPSAEVIGAEPLAGNDAAQSLRAGYIKKLTKSPDTIADGARTLAVGEITFPHLQQLDNFYEVSEDRILYWTQWLTHLLKIQIEPTCAMSMEAVVQHLQKSKKGKKVLIILSGANIDRDTHQKIWGESRLTEIPESNY